MLLKVLSEQFDKAGFEVSTALDGEKALKSLEKSKPDLVLLDIILPKINGFDVLKAIKENPATLDIPVIMISNLGRDEDIKQAIKLGAVDYYIKAQHPIFEIIEKVGKFLSLPKSPLEKPKAAVKEKKVAAPEKIAVEEKPIEVEKVPEKPIEKIVEKPKLVEEKPAKIIPEKIVEEKPAEIISEKPVKKSLEIVVEKPTIKAIEKLAEKVVEKPKKEAVKEPAEEAGELINKIIGIAKESAKDVIKKQAERAAQKLKVIEKPIEKKIEEKPVVVERPIEEKAKKEEKYPQLPKSARKFIRMKKAELNRMELAPEEYKEEVEKIYQMFSRNKKSVSSA